jgi:membrane protease YdiL (CAAX protease family)
MINPFISTSGNLRNGWWIAIFFVVLTALLLPLIFLGRASGTPPPIWQQALVVIAASVICQALRRRPLHELTGRVNFQTLIHASAGLAVGATLMFVPALLLVAAGAVRFAPNASGLEALADAVLLMTAVAVAEEFLFRGFLFQRLIDGLGVWPAQVLIGGLFVLTHSDALTSAGALGWVAGVNIFIASLMFGFAFLRTGGLAMPIAIHLAANVVQGGVLGLGVSGNAEQGLFRAVLLGPDWLTGGAFGLEASVPGLVCVALIAAGLYLWRPEGRVQTRTTTA